MAPATNGRRPLHEVRGWFQYHTGGGCLALRHAENETTYFLATDEQSGAEEPRRHHTVAVGRYVGDDSEGEVVGMEYEGWRRFLRSGASPHVLFTVGNGFTF